MPQIGVDLNKHILQHVTLKAKEAVAMQIQQAEQQMGQVAEGENLEAMTQGQIATLEAQFLGEVQQLQAQMSGAGQPDPVIQLKQQELQRPSPHESEPCARSQGCGYLVVCRPLQRRGKFLQRIASLDQ